MCLNSFLKAPKGNNRISKSRAFHNVGAAYTKDLSKNELAHIEYPTQQTSKIRHNTINLNSLCTITKI